MRIYNAPGSAVQYRSRIQPLPVRKLVRWPTGILLLISGLIQSAVEIMSPRTRQVDIIELTSSSEEDRCGP